MIHRDQIPISLDQGSFQANIPADPMPADPAVDLAANQIGGARTLNQLSARSKFGLFVLSIVFVAGFSYLIFVVSPANQKRVKDHAEQFATKALNDIVTSSDSNALISRVLDPIFRQENLESWNSFQSLRANLGALKSVTAATCDASQSSSSTRNITASAQCNAHVQFERGNITARLWLYYYGYRRTWEIAGFQAQR